MADSIGLLYLLKGSYSGAFVAFWFAILLVCVVLWTFEFRNAIFCYKLERVAFWIFGIAMVVFAVTRPFGIARDDSGYLNFYDTLCQTLICNHWIQGGRDWGWFSLVGLIKSFWDTPRVMLLISAVALLVKFWIVFKLSRRPLIGLLFFAAVFYQVQDLTALRVSLSIALFMLSIYFLSRQLKIVGSMATFLLGFIHQQAFLSPLILLSWILKRRYIVFAVLTLLPIFLLVLGIHFQVYKEIIPYENITIIKSLVVQGIAPYLDAGQSGAYKQIRVLPYSYLPLILVVVCFSRDVFVTENQTYRYSAMSFVIACWLAWLCAGWQEPQARLFEYFSLPTVLLVGNFRNSIWANFGVIVVSAVFVVRYNVLHPLLIG